MPLVSCIVPVWNGEPYLAAAIESVLAQDHEPLELLIVDDGSTDGSVAIAGSYGSAVRIVAKENGGAPSARNVGIREARGEYLTFLDGDDLYRPAKVSTQLRRLTAKPGLDLCLCTAKNFWEPGLENERARYEAAGRILISHGFATLLAHRSVFDSVGFLNESRPAGDFIDWYQRAIDLGLTAEVIPDVLIDRRMHAASHSRTRASLDDYFEIARARIARDRG